MTEQFNRPTPQDTEVVERGGLLPVGTYANGMSGPALPGFITQPFESFKRLVDQGYEPGNPQSAEDAFNVAGAAMVGGLAAPRPRGSIGMSGRLGQAAEPAETRLGGNSIYSGLDKGTASPKLREAGIPGIKYFDQGSRTAGEGSRNYVVFDDNLIEILRKYGLLGMAGGAAANEIMNNSNKAIAQQLMQDDANKYRGAI
jgi:hypothetical protein